MLKIATDVLIMDSGVNEKERFYVIAVGGTLVDDKGILSKLGKNLSVQGLKRAAMAVGSSKYQNDKVLAFNAGDTVFSVDPIGQFLLEQGLATKQNI